MDKAVITVKIEGQDQEYELEIPLDVSVKEICAALIKALKLEERKINISGYYIKAENPSCFLKGNDILKKFNISNGTTIILI